MKPLAVPTATLQRIAVAASGLHRVGAFGRGLGAGHRVLEHLGHVQIDTISVVRRAHEHVIGARAEGFRPNDWNRLVARGDAFEYWAHAAAYLPMSAFRFSLPRMKRLAGTHPWGMRVGADVRRAVLERIRAEGPLRARDFDDEARQEIAGWGRYKDSKIALDQLWHEGTLLIAARDGFEKTYDLTERALPAGVDLRMPSREEQAAFLIEGARRSLGVFAAPHVTWLRKDAELRAAVAAGLDAAVEAGDLVPVQAPGSGTPSRWYADAAGVATPPRVSRRPRMLSPFDPLLIHRDRPARLFDFDYQLECYVPEAKRRHGYFVLPVLHGTRFVARADCRADRARGVFEIRRLILEAGVQPAELPDLLDRAARDLAAQDACAELAWHQVLTHELRPEPVLEGALRARAMT